MAFGPVTKYNQIFKILGSSSYRDWDDATAGNIMFCLAKASYTPNAAHTTVANLGVSGTDYIVAGAGAPIAATGLNIDDVSTLGSAYYDSDAADFGATITVEAKYLICVQPVTAGTFTSTAKLLWYVDLKPTGGSLSVLNGPLKINTPAGGWYSLT